MAEVVPAQYTRLCAAFDELLKTLHAVGLKRTLRQVHVACRMSPRARTVPVPPLESWRAFRQGGVIPEGEVIGVCYHVLGVRSGAKRSDLPRVEAAVGNFTEAYSLWRAVRG